MQEGLMQMKKRKQNKQRETSDAWGIGSSKLYDRLHGIAKSHADISWHIFYGYREDYVISSGLLLGRKEERLIYFNRDNNDIPELRKLIADD
jgi:hypothetical protein